MVSGTDIGVGSVGVRKIRKWARRIGKMIHVVNCIPLKGLSNPFFLIVIKYYGAIPVVNVLPLFVYLVRWFVGSFVGSLVRWLVGICFIS